MSKITATLDGAMTLEEFVALGGVVEWTVDEYVPHGQFHDPIALLHGTILEPVDLWTTIERSGGITTYRLEAWMLEGRCGEWQFDVGTDGLDLRSILITSGVDCYPMPRDPAPVAGVPEAGTLLMVAIGLVVLLKRFR